MMNKEKEVWNKAFENLVDDMKDLTREQLAAGFFELGWRAADENPPKGTSLIKWQTGRPKADGYYLITYNHDGSTFCITGYWRNGTWLNINNWELQHESVSAWCKLSDVEPYKE